MRPRLLKNTSILALFSFLIFTPALKSFAAVQPQAAATLQGEARKKEIARKVGVLSTMGYGLRVHTEVGRNGEEMILNFALKEGGYSNREELIFEDLFTIDLQSKDISFGDMVSWGTMKLPAAQDLFATRDENDDGADSHARAARRARLGKVILKELSEMKGVTFGYNPSSTGYCGVSFMGLLIVDEENGVIYELPLTDSGSC